ncbi:hypothetical protein O3G_MSEX002316 [Manduca sexta]|uniref:Uncharacterized protein n=1 Tax=Manduca sexta TaxID=7130 RepID=A0A921YN73_MANSE|nr:hypothetical protein O3G_MSEX002316 [Manduca sexta]
MQDNISDIDVVREENNNPPNATEDDTPLTIKERFQYFFKTSWRGVVCVITPLIFIPLLTPFPPEDTIIMFVGSMVLAYAVEQSGLHKRLALSTIRAIGYSHYRILFAMSFTTMFVSMWITNTAATTMMVPINFALLKVFEDQNLLSIYEEDASGDRIATDITTCYFCTATFSATIGGIGTLVGTATNLVFKGLFAKAYPDAPEYLSFPNFSIFAIPYMVIMELAMYLLMLVKYLGFLRPKSKAAIKSKLSPEGIEAAKRAVDVEWEKLGRITFWEIMVIILFGGAIVMFFSRSPQIFPGWGDKIAEHFDIKQPKFVQDSAAAMLVGFLMFLLPSHLTIFKNCKAKTYGELTDKPIPSVLRWKEMNEIMPYSFMFLLGGGFALSEAAKKDYSDLNGKIGEMLKNMQSLPNLFIILLIIIFTVFITNFASNVAVCNVIAPIAMQLARETGANPLWYNIAAGFSASYCFCLPVGTPGNLVVQSAASIPTGKMIIAGAGPTAIAIIISWVALCFWAPVIWPDLHILPDWAGMN